MISTMPNAAPHACKPGCPALVPSGQRWCPEHTQKAQADDRGRRGSSHQRGYDGRWRARRASFLAKNPLCVMCLAETPSRVTPATEADHITPHKGDQVLFDDDNNLQGLCKMHHSQKTAREDGAFGRAVVR